MQLCVHLLQLHSAVTPVIIFQTYWRLHQYRAGSAVQLPPFNAPVLCYPGKLQTAILTQLTHQLSWREMSIGYKMSPPSQVPLILQKPVIRTWRGVRQAPGSTAVIVISVCRSTTSQLITDDSKTEPISPGIGEVYLIAE
jgi:hypothetical protein